VTPQLDRKESPLLDFAIPFTKFLFWAVFVVILLIIAVNFIITL
jgi:hypothetical protein